MAQKILDYAKSSIQGKGDSSRFSYQSDKKYKKNYDRIFRKNKID